MRVIVLGSAAGGGFPQWNCNCRNCRGVREGRIRAKPRTQSSIAVSCDSRHWLLINASPDILHQLAANRALHPGEMLRGTPIRAILLVDSQLDHTLGLLLLREGRPLRVYCTQDVYDDLTRHNPVLPLLNSYCGVQWQRITADEDVGFEVDGVGGLRFQAIPLSGYAPPYSPLRNRGVSLDSNIGLTVEDAATGRKLFYAPGLCAIDQRVAQCMKSANCIMVDGTFWSDDEMIQTGVGVKHATEMGHLAQSGSDGMLAALVEFSSARRILVHINNTNPILDENSPERRLVEEQGIEIAYDGMELSV